MIDICPPRMLTVSQVAERLSISRSRAYELIEARLLAHHRLGGPRGTIRVCEKDLQAFLAESRVEPAADIPPPPPQTSRTKLKHIRL